LVQHGKQSQPVHRQHWPGQHDPIAVVVVAELFALNSTGFS